ncbi:MAG: FAD binding domain-containing protein [Hyphomicrobiales bacterium]
MSYARPQNLDDALALLAEDSWQILAGGTDYYPALHDEQPHGNLLDVTILDGARVIQKIDGHWAIGAAVTWGDIIGAGLPHAFDALKLAAREVGSVQIQNRATLAGNICNASPAADGVPPLLVLDAEVELASVRGVRRSALSEFILGNRRTALASDELVTRILIPEGSAEGTSSFLKLGARSYLVISISMVAVRLVVGGTGQIDDVAISVGACSEVALRLPEAEDAIRNANIRDDWSTRLKAEHFATLSPIDDVRASAEYRNDATLELVRRTLIAAMHEAA